MVLMAGRVGVGERERGCSQPRVVLKGSLWKQKKGTHMSADLKALTILMSVFLSFFKNLGEQPNTRLHSVFCNRVVNFPQIQEF